MRKDQKYPCVTLDEFRAHIVGSAVMGAINAAILEWYRGTDDVLLVDLVERGLEFLTPILDP